MKVKEHYDQHLGNFYSWMLGDFNTKQAEQAIFFQSHHIHPNSSRVAIDLGAGNGVQSVPLVRLGFSVVAVDFNKQLLTELKENSKGQAIIIIEADITDYPAYQQYQPELIVCMGDTLTHLADKNEVRQLIIKAFELLIDKGKIILSFRDLTVDLVNEQRFIPVKADENRILTCFLEYFPEHVNVSDILYEKLDGKWNLKVSTYPKVRIAASAVIDIIAATGFNIISSEVVNRMVYIVAEKIAHPG